MADGTERVVTAEVAIIAMAVVSLASIGRDYRVHMKVADRMRLVNPAKAPAPPAEAAATVEELSERRRA